MIILIIMALLITFNTIRLAIYITREEISVMKLVGASSMYIRGPFVVAGMLYGLIAGIITLILFYPITAWLGKETMNFFIGVNVFDFYIAHFGEIFLIIMAAGIIMGAISSFLAVRRYLN
jgi:cell division transport system permease protein